MTKIKAPKMVYIKGEEMTRYAMDLILEKWINPHIDTSEWEFFDLSCKSRDDTEDQVLADVVNAGKRIKAIFKEPTITPTDEQKNKMGLKKSWGSPNGAMRRGWNGITISRDTIMIDGLDLGYKRPVFFERQAVGGEYGGGFAETSAGTVTTTFTPAEGGDTVQIDQRVLDGNRNMVVTYHNPLDNVPELARHFFGRCLAADITPYVVTKKTVFKWQEPFWQIMKKIFDTEFKDKFNAKNLLESCGGELHHIISDAATMDLVKWKDGGYGMAAHNYDGDMLTDLMSQIHRSPGFISSNLVGRADDGSIIKEFEASHGTVSDMDRRRLEGIETSLNPLGLVDALIGAMNHSASLSKDSQDDQQIKQFTSKLRKSMNQIICSPKGTRDVVGKSGSTTEQFIDAVAELL